MTVTRHISVATAIEKNKIASNVAFIALLDIDVVDPDNPGVVVEVISICANNEDFIWTQGGVEKVYTAANFDFQIDEEAGGVPDVNLVCRDYTGAIMQQMEKYRGGVGFKVTLTIVNSGNPSQPAEISEQMEVIGASAKDYEITFKLGAENALSIRWPRRRAFRNVCAWRYKGVECKYHGALASCDFGFDTPNGCMAHDNTENFGGFPGIIPGLVQSR
jgi:phage-related protein